MFQNYHGSRMFRQVNRFQFELYRRVRIDILETARLNTQETWELEYDEQIGSHTKLPNLFHDMVVNKMNTIYEHVLSVNVTKGERKVNAHYMIPISIIYSSLTVFTIIRLF
jgi:hypothetical protein